MQKSVLSLSDMLSIYARASSAFVASSAGLNDKPLTTLVSGFASCASTTALVFVLLMISCVSADVYAIGVTRLAFSASSLGTMIPLILIGIISFEMPSRAFLSSPIYWN